MDPEMTYERACSEHDWSVPERYNIAADVCDKHPPEKLAMVWERYDGERRELAWGELQELSNRAANLLAGLGIGKGDRVAVVLPPTPETAAIFFGTWKLGAILLSMSVLYGDDGIGHRLRDAEPKVLVTDADNVERFDPSLVEEIVVLDPELLAGAAADPVSADTAAEDPAQLYYTSGTTGMAKGIVHAHRYLLAHEEFIYCHDVGDGERFHGMGEWAWAAGIAPLLGPWRLGAVQCVFQRKGGFDPAEQLDFLSRNEVANVFTTPTAMRAMMAIGDAGKRYPMPRTAHRLLGRRAAQPGSDQVVPQRVRDHGARLLRADRVVSAVRELPVHGRPRGLDGQADAGLGRADPRRGREPRRAGRAR